MPDTSSPISDAEMIAVLQERVAHLEIVRGRGPVGERLRELEALRWALERLEASRWRPIAEKPSAPVQVEYYFGKLVWHDQNGNSFDDPPYRDERRALGFWDGEGWHDCGTGHETFEDWREEMHLPTHWRPLPPAPPASEGSALLPPLQMKSLPAMTAAAPALADIAEKEGRDEVP